MKGHYLPLATIAWGISLSYLFGNLEFLGGHTGLTGIPALDLFGFELRNERHYYFLIWGIALAALWATRNLLDSRPGRAIRALRGQLEMAESFGVDGARLKIVVFVYAALLACISGWLYAHLQRFVNPTPFGINQGIEYLFMAVVGGAGSVWGAVIGATLITLAKQLLQDRAAARARPQRQLRDRRLRRADGAACCSARAKASGRGSRIGCRRDAPEPVGDAAPLPSRAKPPPSGMLLEVKAARKQFGGLVAVNDLSFAIAPGEILGLIGPNGAGKSTMFNLISGALAALRGRCRLSRRLDRRLARRTTIARRGIGRTFQHVKLMPQMSVLDNVALGAYLRGETGVFRAALKLDRAEEARTKAEASRAIARVGLAPHLHEAAAACRSASSGSSRSPARSPPTRRCCCWTSLRPGCVISRSRSSRHCCGN